MLFIKKIISKFNTNNVIDMSGMFYECSSLKKLNLSNFNTYNVTNIGCMLFRYLSLEELNLSNFNTNNVIDMDSMFCGCSVQFQMKIKAQYKNIKEEAFH